MVRFTVSIQKHTNNDERSITLVNQSICAYSKRVIDDRLNVVLTFTKEKLGNLDKV